MNTELSLRETLLNEIESYNEACPPVEMWIDEVGNIFWSSKDGEMVHIDQDRGGIAKYIDENHSSEYATNSPDCVHGCYVIWNNSDFDNPYHISDFTNQISTITQ